MAGDSTVVLGRKGSAFVVEIGLVPTFSIQAFHDYPLSLTLPTFLTLGGPGFFGDGGVLGVFSTGPSVSVPLSFIPKRLGAGRRAEVVGHLRVGMNF